MFSIKDSSYFKRATRIFLAATTVLLLTTFLSYIFHPSEENIRNIIEGGPSSSSENTGMENVWLYITNNGFIVPLQMVLFSLIPIPFLYVINLLSTVIAPGVLLGFLFGFDTNEGMKTFVSFLPHYIVEILAMCIVVSALYNVNKTVIRMVSNLFRKHKKQSLSFKVASLDLIKVYITLAFPLYVIAAFTEAYIADFLYNLMG